jgi:hypothetical protein
MATSAQFGRTVEVSGRSLSRMISTAVLAFYTEPTAYFRLTSVADRPETPTNPLNFSFFFLLSLCVVQRASTGIQQVLNSVAQVRLYLQSEDRIRKGSSDR